MSIGTNIKKLRRDNDITQEELAEYLGITAKAVSQWETDRTVPDISLLPALCHIFDVSSDMLLGIDVQKNNENIQKYLDEAFEAGYSGNYEKCTEILREAHRKFPRDFRIMERLTNALVCVYSRKGIKDYDEVYDLCNHIIDKCTDSAVRSPAIENLALAYGYAGKTEEMIKIAKQMPHVRFSYENFMTYQWMDSEGGFEESQGYMSFLIYHTIELAGLLAYHQNNGEFIYKYDERIKFWKLQIDLLELIFPDGDYQYAAQLGYLGCTRLVGSYVNKNDLENAWYWLEKKADFDVYMDTYDFESAHTSLLLRGYKSGGWIMEAAGNFSAQMLEWLNDSDFDVLRSDARYGRIVEKLKATAKKP